LFLNCLLSSPHITFLIKRFIFVSKLPTQQSTTVYGSAITEYWNSKANKTESVRVGKARPALKVDEHFESRAEALRVLNSRLKSENRGQVSGSLSIYGMDVVAGNKLELKGDKRFDGLKFGITRVTHSIGESGFVTGLEFES